MLFRATTEQSGIPRMLTIAMPQFRWQIRPMFERAKEYLKLGAARPPGTIWAMERTYFELRHKYPGKDEYAYLRLALLSRYPDKLDQIQHLARIFLHAHSPCK